MLGSRVPDLALGDTGPTARLGLVIVVDTSHP